jgi:competence protein ComEC
MGRAPLVHAALILAAGIALGLMRPVPLWGGPLLVLLAGVGGAAALASARRVGPAPWRGAAVLGLMAGAGILLGIATRAEADRSCIRWVPDDRRVVIYGVVTSAPPSPLRARMDSVALAGSGVACSAEAPLRLRGDAEAGSETLRVGAAFSASARWWSPPAAAPGPLRRPGAFLVDTLHAASAPSRAAPAHEIRRAARDRVDLLFGDRASLAASLLLAQRDALDGEVRERFARAGLSHLLAISGLHVGLVCGLLLLLGSLLRMERRWRAVLAGAGTVGYVLLLGAPHSASRAALQLVLLLAATALQRPTRPEALVAAAAMVLLALEPAALLSAGFQLSFAGVAGLLALRRPFLGVLGVGNTTDAPASQAGRAWRWLADALATSLAATLATAPIVAWHFSQVAPIGIVANLVAIPLLSLALPALVVALLVGAVAPAAGAFLAGPGSLALGLLDRTAAFAAAIPGGAITVHGTTALVWTAAAFSGYVASQRLGRVRTAIRAAAWAAIAGLILAAAPLRPPTGAVEIHVIDVGQGDAVAVRSPRGRWVLVDAGVAGRGYDTGERLVVPYLARRGARRVEGIVLTHPHADHMGGAAAVVRALRPRWTGDPGSAVPSPVYLHLLRAARDQGITWVGLREGHALVLDGVRFQVLHPLRVGETEPDANDLSVVVLVSFGDFRALLTGDATAAVETRIVERFPHGLGAQVLKVGHHGSHTSTTVEFLDAASPAIALVSAGRGNRYGHPHRVVVDRLTDAGVRVYRTDRHGTLVVRADGSGDFTVETGRVGVE